MNSRDRIQHILAGQPGDCIPVLPIVHTALAHIEGVPPGRYFTDSEIMAQVAVRSAQRFGFDGVQLTLGVIAEPEALGAVVAFSPDSAPVLKERLLADPGRMDALRKINIASGGRLPMFQQAVSRVVNEIGDHTFVISTLRGPLNIAAQLRGVEQILVDMIENPEAAMKILEFTTDLAVQVAHASLASGAHAVMFGEATCSPNFISPRMYREFMHPLHSRLIRQVKAMGWKTAGLHVCGDIRSIFEDLVSTGVDLLDVDYQVDATEALALNQGRVALRGNLDPSSLFFLGDEKQVHDQTLELCRQVHSSPWILSSGCDIPAGTPAKNLAAFVKAAHQSAG